MNNDMIVDPDFIGIIFVRYFKVCRYLVHAVAEEGAKDGK